MKPTKLRKPWRRYNLYRRNWRALGSTIMLATVILTAYTIVAVIDQREEAREAEHLAQKLQWHQEANLITILNEEPLIDKDTGMALVARIETYGDKK